MTVARRILIHVALGAAFVVAVVTAVTYWLVYDALKKRDLQHLATYVTERMQREEARFQQIQSNLTLVRGQFLKRLELPDKADLQTRWDAAFRCFPDGAWRSREQFADGRKYAQLWCHKNWKLTPDAQRKIVVAQDLCEELLPGWVDTFPSVYFNFPGPANIGFDARIPSWVWDMPADYDTEKMEWLQLALPKVLPEPNVFLWTGVQQDVDLQTENPLINAPMVSVFLPIYREGEFLGSVGHDMFMTGMLDEAMRSDIAGAAHLIFRGDGRLVAHPVLRQRILLSKGMLKAWECGDPTVESLYRTCIAQTGRQFSGFDAASDAYYSAARLAGPNWFFVIVMPRDRLQQQASASAQWVLWSGLISLALMLGFIAAILRTQIARPLAELTHATEAMSAGVATGPLPTARADELGELAASFREMVARVVAREDDLRELNAGLEKRVAERTDELARALARERELGEMKSSFVSLVSHEFRTPLGVIMSAAEVLQRYFERLSPEKRARHLDMIFRSTRNLANLIEEVLLVGRVEEGRMQFAPVPVGLEKFCRSLTDELLSATGGACPIRFEATTPLDGAVSDETVLRHILSNLLSNAVKYSEPGTPVEFTAERRGHDVIFTVRDHGIGIPLEDQPRLFTSFNRARNVGTRPGTGLGLVVVQRCVQLHRGTIALESDPGVGTTVTVTLPVFQPVVAP
jgi:signal transduction histidine kinase